VGHTRFHRSDFSVHAREHFTLALHTFSNRTVNTECVNGEGTQNRYAGYLFLYINFIITKTSLQSHQSVNGASFLAKRHARAAKMYLAAGHLCLLAGCAGLLGLCPRWRQRAQVIETCLVGKRIFFYIYIDFTKNILHKK
jgi:hypothetical protein